MSATTHGLRALCCAGACVVLIDNHVHLLVAADKAGAVSSAMRLIGQSYVQAFNVRHPRSGTLWQERFKSCLVQTERYCLRSCATSNSICCALAWWHFQLSNAGQACTRIWGLRKASSSRRTRSICILAAMQPSGCLSMQVASCRSSLRGRTCNQPSPPAGARLGRFALPGHGGACIGQANDVPSARSSCRGDSGWSIASVPLNGAAAVDEGGCWRAVRRTGFAEKIAVGVGSLIPAVAKRKPPGVLRQRGAPALAKIG